MNFKNEENAIKNIQISLKLKPLTQFTHSEMSIDYFYFSNSTDTSC